jgi:two-component system NarL family sensor kinase
VTCVALLAAFAGLVAQGPTPPSLSPENLSGIPMSIGFSVVGALVVSRQPRHRLGWLFLAVGLACALTLFLFGYAYVGLETKPGSLPGALVVGWVSSWIWALTFAPAFTLGILLFPDGRLPSRRWRWAAAVPVAGIAVDIAGTAFAPGRFDGFPSHDNPVGFRGAAPAMSALQTIGWPLVTAGMVLGVASQVARWRRAEPGTLARRQITLLALAAGTVTVMVLMPGGGNDAGSYVVGFALMLLVPAAVGTAIVRHRLYDIDVTLNRSLVYAALTACVLVAYAAVVGVAGQVAGADSAPAAGVAAALAAVALLPMRGRLQRGIDRLMYGEGGDPYRAVTGLADRLTAVAAPGEALQTVVDTIRSALRASYVAVEIDGRTAAAAGSSEGSAGLVRPIVHQGVTLGDLVVAGRSGRGLDARERSLVDELVRHAAPALLAARLTDDLQDSRQRLVAAREDDRRRLRRDLHDGLGPTLAGVALGIDVAIARLDVDPDEARALLKEVKDETNATVDEVRRIAYALRPPALDELGLTGAVAQTAERLSRGRGELLIEVEAIGPLPALDAATEVAAYRIATEAMTNATRHSSARHICVRLTADRELDLDVRDDGQGIAATASPGVGLAAMRERTAELGGTLEIMSGPAGTSVRASLPLGNR